MFSKIIDYFFSFFNRSRPTKIVTSTSKLVSPGGVHHIMSVGPEMPPLPKSTNEITIASRAKETCRYECGHESSAWFALGIYGETSVKIDAKTLCPECSLALHKKYLIRCCLCGLSIAPGSGVACYDKSSPGILLDIATVIKDDAAIGCLRFACCPGGGFFSGHWTEEGFLPYFKELTAMDEVVARK